MTSFLIVSTDQTKRDAHILAYTSKLSIAPIDITRIERDTETKPKAANKTASPKQSIGIDDIKQMQKKLFFKPIQSKTKAVIIDEAHLLTMEAQNALLKVLEEPPENTVILLSSDSRETLLPTIISRCQVIILQKENYQLTDDEKDEYSTFIDYLPNLSIGEKLKKAELLGKDKEKALEWIEKTILILREKIINALDTSDTLDTLDTLRRLQSLHTLLKTTNVNPRFAIENALLQLSNQLEQSRQ